MDREKMIAVFQKTYGFPSSETDREYLLAFAWFEKGWKAAQQSVEPTLPSDGGSVRENIARINESKKVR